MLNDNQVPSRFRQILDEQINLYNRRRSIEVRNEIPSTTEIPIENPLHWLRIPDVVSVFVDMINSTQLSAENHDNGTAGVYQLYTGTAVRLFAEFNAPYIDVRGDGVLALFNKTQPHRALAAAVTFKTFTEEELAPRVREKTGIVIGSHIGIDQQTVLVKKIGFKRYEQRSDRQNEVWAGRPVNMSAKLASLSKDKELLVSERYFKNFTDEHVLKSCGCLPPGSYGYPYGIKKDLWKPIDLGYDSRFDFSTAYKLESKWCCYHGEAFCEAILALDL